MALRYYEEKTASGTPAGLMEEIQALIRNRHDPEARQAGTAFFTAIKYMMNTGQLIASPVDPSLYMNRVLTPQASIWERKRNRHHLYCTFVRPPALAQSEIRAVLTCDGSIAMDRRVDVSVQRHNSM